MPQISGVMLFAILFLPLCRCFSVEISLVDRNTSRSIKLVCVPITTNLNPGNDYTILWHGFQFGGDERQRLSELLQTDDDLVPNISINSSQPHMWYLLSPKNTSASLILTKKGVLRDSLASIPLEDGVCLPGYRIHEDRCFPCFPGSYTSGQQYECFLCPKDFYMDRKAADSCRPCPEGKKTLAQGADSEEICTYFDEFGRPIPEETPPWTIIFSLIGVILACVWLIVILLFVRHWKQLCEDDVEQPERVLHIKRGSTARRKERPDDHVYAEIGDYDDSYEVPRKYPHTYVDMETPPVPPKRKLSLEENQYGTVPLKGNIKKLLYEYIDFQDESTPVHSPSCNRPYGILPMQKKTDRLFYEWYDHINNHNQSSSEVQYKPPIKSSESDLHKASIIKSSDNQYEVPIRKSSDRTYSKLKNTSDDDLLHWDDANEKRKRI